MRRLEAETSRTEAEHEAERVRMKEAERLRMKAQGEAEKARREADHEAEPVPLEEEHPRIEVTSQTQLYTAAPTTSVSGGVHSYMASPVYQAAATTYAVPETAFRAPHAVAEEPTMRPTASAAASRPTVIPGQPQFAYQGQPLLPPTTIAAPPDYMHASPRPRLEAPLTAQFFNIGDNESQDQRVSLALEITRAHLQYLEVMYRLC